MKNILFILTILTFNSVSSQKIFGELSYSERRIAPPTYNLDDMIEMQNGIKKIATDYKIVIPYLETELSPTNCKSLLGKKCNLYRQEISRIKTKFLKLEYSNDYFENRSYVLSSVKKMNMIDFELQQSFTLKNKISEQKIKIAEIEKLLNDEKCDSLKRECKKIKKSISKIKKRQAYFIKKSSYVTFSDEIAEFEILLDEIIYLIKA
ncbi:MULTISPECIES: hypothetical protein [Flavobacteriaceae]|uniref:Uncharacterized protein n=1 Tax=Bizionia algoritergicola TaxID=291187 RepID=A0A5D0R2C8_9FLAO|nr:MULTISPECIES: hypothetical protein [Flavobacteriaceae]OBX17459.1 hypothetical protein BAA08_16385 [Bizionia sp. APA-3]TYB75657.1 hypothetical protein ES675_05930 [Bizionia algoritergicola]